MRSLKELFIVVKNHDYIYIIEEIGGICGLCSHLDVRGIISAEERCCLWAYIEDHRPKWYSRHYDKNQKNDPYYWKRGEWAPRLKWINAQIKKLK